MRALGLKRARTAVVPDEGTAPPGRGRPRFGDPSGRDRGPGSPRRGGPRARATPARARLEARCAAPRRDYLRAIHLGVLAMVRYSLTCADGHAFDSWFASASAFDDLAGRGLLACADCGSARVGKALMAPAVATSAAPRPERPLSAPRDPREEALARMRQAVEAESDYVGLSFAAEARAMHEGEAPARSIWGEAAPAEARALIEDGVPVAPLPFRPRRASN